MTKTIINYLLVASILISYSCQNSELNPKTDKTIVFSKITSCDNGVKFVGFEFDKKTEVELVRFFNSVRLSDDCRYDSLNVYGSNYLCEMILLIFNDKIILEEDSFDSKTQFDEWKNDVLFHVRNINILNQITDSLLLKNDGSAISALWFNLDKTKLKNLDKYINTSSSWYQIAELIAIYHSQSNMIEKEKLLESKVYNDPNFQNEKEILNSYLKENKKLSYEMFNELFFED